MNSIISKLHWSLTVMVICVTVSSASAQLFKGQFKERKWQKRAKHGQYKEDGGVVGTPLYNIYRDQIGWSLSDAIKGTRNSISIPNY